MRYHLTWHARCPSPEGARGALLTTILPRQTTREPDPEDPWGFGRPETRANTPYGELVDTEDLEAVDRALASSTPAPASDASAPASDPLAPAIRRRISALVLCALGIVVGAAVAAGALWSSGPPVAPTAAALSEGGLVLSSHPDGAVVAIDGLARGTTPLVLQLPVGQHDVVVSLDGSEPVRLAAPIAAGGVWRRHLVLTPAALSASTGALRVETERAGAVVTVDGVGAGVTPLTIGSLTPGEHVVEIRGASGPISRRVTVAPGATTSLVLGADRPSTLSGWISVPAPFELQIVEDGRLLGVSRSERIMVSAGRHVLDLVSEPFAFRQRVTVVVEPERTASVRVDLPSAPLSVNALPWATVSVGERTYGETPVANIALPIGPHTITLRHPMLGERTVPVTVRLDSPNRVSVDLRR